MPESLTSVVTPKRNPYSGVFPTLTAILLALVYFRVKRLSEDWTMTPHVVIICAIVVLGALGLARLFKTIDRRIPIRSWLRFSHQRMSIPLEGWIYLAIMFVLFTGSLLTNQNTLMLVFAFMAGPFVINGWMTFGMLQSARIQRSAPKRAMQGELFSVELELSNRRPLLSLWMITTNDEIQHSQEKLEGIVLFSRVSPRSSLTGQYELSLAHRGRYRFGPLRITSRFPLGLIERSRVFPGTEDILIYPRIGTIAPHWRQKLDGASELVSRPQPHRGIYNDDFHRLREFRSGDNPRAIHWRSTARRGEVILREFQQNRDHILAIVLDLFQSPMEPLRSEMVDQALSFVVSLLVERGRDCHDGFLSLAASGNKPFRWEGQGHASSLETLFDGMADFEPGPASDATAMLKDVLQHSTLSTQILVLTTRKPDLPYHSLLTQRVDMLNLNDVSLDSLLIFETTPFSR